MLYQLSYFRFFVSFVRFLHRTHSEINFKNLCCFPGDSSVGLRLNLWEKMDSNHRRYKPADLQSAPFGHSGILPFFRFFRAIPSLDFVSSVSHCRKATPFLVTRPPRTHSEINFKNLCCFVRFLRWTSYPRSVIAVRQLLPSSLVRLGLTPK